MVGWVLLGLVAPLCYALGAILMAKMQVAAPKSLLLAAGLLAAAGVVMLVVMVLTGSWWFFEGDFATGHWATLGAMANQAAIFVLMFEIIRRAGPVFFLHVQLYRDISGCRVGNAFFWRHLYTLDLGCDGVDVHRPILCEHLTRFQSAGYFSNPSRCVDLEKHRLQHGYPNRYPLRAICSTSAIVSLPMRKARCGFHSSTSIVRMPRR